MSSATQAGGIQRLAWRWEGTHWFARLCLAMVVLNSLDAFFTIAFLRMGWAYEMNPFMRIAYQASPIWFVLLKLAAVLVGIAVLFANRERRLARYGLLLCAAAYAGVVLYHVAFLARVAINS
jgi:hypothetical protein